MTALPESPTDRDVRGDSGAATRAPTPHPLRRAMDARDHSALVAQLAPDVVMHSPVVGTRRFEGRAAVAALFEVLIDRYEYWECDQEVVAQDVHLLIARARIGGRDLEEVVALQSNDEDQVTELRVYARPLTGIAAFAQVAGPRLARRRGRARAAIARALTAPLPGLLAVGDRFVARIALPQASDHSQERRG